MMFKAMGGEGEKAGKNKVLPKEVTLVCDILVTKIKSS